MAFLKCQFCGALYVHKGFRVPSGACDACWLEINSQAFKRRNKEKGEPVSTEPRTYEVGYLCENCLYPLEDTRPGVEDFRVAVGRTKRLCRKCAAIEDCPNRDAEGHGSLGGCWLCNPIDSEIEHDIDSALEDHKNGYHRKDCPWCAEENYQRDMFERNKMRKARDDR